MPNGFHFGSYYGASKNKSTEDLQINKLKVNEEMRVAWEVRFSFSSFQPPLCLRQSACNHNRTRVVEFKTASNSA